MPDDYTSATGGSLKLKGGLSVKDSKIDKKKKKKKTKPVETKEPERSGSADGEREDSAVREVMEKDEREAEGEEKLPEKTESEKRYEEQKRRRLQDRLKREGLKTHKEKVEELNKYLSNLSEHHDMPRIGPG